MGAANVAAARPKSPGPLGPRGLSREPTAEVCAPFLGRRRNRQSWCPQEAMESLDQRGNDGHRAVACTEDLSGNTSASTFVPASPWAAAIQQRIHQPRSRAGRSTPDYRSRAARRPSVVCLALRSGRKRPHCGTWRDRVPNPRASRSPFIPTQRLGSGHWLQLLARESPRSLVSLSGCL